MNRSRSVFQLLLFAIVFITIPVLPDDIAKSINEANIAIQFNGTFSHPSITAGSKANSPNGLFWCRYDIGEVSDEMRELKNFEFYKGSQRLFVMEDVPGSDLHISNAGIIAFMDMRRHFNHEVTIHFYSQSGLPLFSRSFQGASLFGFSAAENKFGVGTAEHLYIIAPMEQRWESYPPADQFWISEDERRVASAYRGNIQVFRDGELQAEFKTGFAYPRAVQLSSQSGLLAAIDKRNLKVYSLSAGKLLFNQKLRGPYSYRDLRIIDGSIVSGIHFRENGVSKGVLKTFDRNGNFLLEQESAAKTFETFPNSQFKPSSTSAYPEIPWPFVPFDSMHTVWNFYEQHMGLGGNPPNSYMHQGLDIITPIAEPTYAVAEGIVKCVLTIGGASYWRLAISPEQVPGYSRGWLYAHLIQSTIQVGVGDTVLLHDYLGDIIEWAFDWGHIHFVQIEDSGLVWQYNDNEWGINYNPLNSLRSNKDTIPPVLENVFANSKFAFCLNETSTYLDADSLYGDVDIIAKVVDYVGDSEWQQPAYETYYWVKKLPGGNIVFPRTLGQRLNHEYDFYDSNHYQEWAPLIYKRDNLLQPSSWMSMQRNFYHLLTNNNGDMLVELSEKNLAFPTYNYGDGDYRIFVEARDQYGNSTVDSMDVKFRNGIVGISGDAGSVPAEFRLRQNYPNPFNPSTNLGFRIADFGLVKLEVYDLSGRRIAILVNEELSPGNYLVQWDGRDERGRGVASGIYIYQLRAGSFSQTRKMLLVK